MSSKGKEKEEKNGISNNTRGNGETNQRRLVLGECRACEMCLVDVSRRRKASYGTKDSVASESIEAMLYLKKDLGHLVTRTWGLRSI